MPIDFGLISGTLTKGMEALKNIRNKRRKEKALFHEVLDEIHDNFSTVIHHYIGKGAKLPRVIDTLKTEKLEEAFAEKRRSNFRFSKMKWGKVDPKHFASRKEYLQYQDFNTEKLLELIKETIRDLKKNKQLYYSQKGWDKSKIKPEKEMEELVRLLILLSKHFEE
jgi:hypothetical protein